MERVVTVSLKTIFEFTKATPATRNMIEGQKVINSDMIVTCGATEKTREKVDLYALCLQSSALTSDPHVITGTLFIVQDENNNFDNENEEDFVVEIVKMECSCKAGNSFTCKHIVAVLLFCNRCTYLVNDSHFS